MLDEPVSALDVSIRVQILNLLVDQPALPFVMPHCATGAPALRPESGRLVACHLY